MKIIPRIKLIIFDGEFNDNEKIGVFGGTRIKLKFWGVTGFNAQDDLFSTFFGNFSKIRDFQEKSFLGFLIVFS